MLWARSDFDCVHIRRLSFAKLQVGRASLAAAGRYSELVALLRARGCHDQALELLQSLSQAPQDLSVPPAGLISKQFLPGSHLAHHASLPVRASRGSWQQHPLSDGRHTVTGSFAVERCREGLCTVSTSCSVLSAAGAAKDLAGLPGVWAAIKYIRAMGPAELDLIRHHARPDSIVEFAMREAIHIVDHTSLGVGASKRGLGKAGAVFNADLACQRLSCRRQGRAVQNAGALPDSEHRALSCLTGRCVVDTKMCFGRWILHEDSESGIDMFAHMRPAISPSDVLPIIQVQIAIPWLQKRMT